MSDRKTLVLVIDDTQNPFEYLGILGGQMLSSWYRHDRDRPDVLACHCYWLHSLGGVPFERLPEALRALRHDLTDEQIHGAVATFIMQRMEGQL